MTGWLYAVLLFLAIFLLGLTAGHYLTCAFLRDQGCDVEFFFRRWQERGGSDRR
jgi:hypothetical protein